MSITRQEIWLRGLEATYRIESETLARDEDYAFTAIDLAEGADFFLRAFELRWEEQLPGEWVERR